MLFQEHMKTFLVLVLTLTALFLWQRNSAQRASHPPSVETKAVQSSPGQVSEGNWAKHSIDRAHQVAEQVQASRRQNDQP
jgi:hypothetical protein